MDRYCTGFIPCYQIWMLTFCLWSCNALFNLLICIFLLYFLHLLFVDLYLLFVAFLLQCCIPAHFRFLFVLVFLALFLSLFLSPLGYFFFSLFISALPLLGFIRLWDDGWVVLFANESIMEPCARVIQCLQGAWSCIRTFEKLANGAVYLDAWLGVHRLFCLLSLVALGNFVSDSWLLDQDLLLSFDLFDLFDVVGNICRVLSFF